MLLVVAISKYYQLGLEGTVGVATVRTIVQLSALGYALAMYATLLLLHIAWSSLDCCLKCQIHPVLSHLVAAVYYMSLALTRGLQCLLACTRVYPRASLRMGFYLASHRSRFLHAHCCRL